MKAVSSRRWRNFFLAVLFLALLPGFESSDIVYDNCKQVAQVAKCDSFKAEGAGEAQNVILLIGDGMGLNQIYATRVFLNGPDHPLVLETLPHRGLVTTCCLGGVTDSAAAVTALACGQKTKKGMLGMSANSPPQSLPNILELAHPSKATGVVSTTAIWDATPAGFAAHVPLRTQDREIARQMITQTKPEVILGGGANAFVLGRTETGEDLITAAQKEGYQVVRTASELQAVDFKNTKRLLGLFAPLGMEYEVRRPKNSTEPHLTEMAQAALSVLSQDPRGFFLMIEGANIDHACHEVNLDRMLGEVAEFDRTVALVLKWAESHPNTLVLVTADHETGGIKIAPAHYKKGDKVKVKWTTQVLPGLYANHSSQRVAIFGQGPNAGAIRPHLDNTEVFCIMKNAFGL